jgi:HK97 family phage prohead protease
VFNSLTTIETKDGNFREQIKPGAFTRALSQKQDVVCCFNHDPNYVLGRTTAGTLRLKQTDRGLFYTCDLPDTSFANGLRESIKRGDINGSSFAFTVGTHGETWSEQRDKNGSTFLQRDIDDVDELIDVSPVTHPQYDGTEVSARQLELVVAELRSGKSRRSKFISAAEVKRRMQSGEPSFEDRIEEATVVRNRRMSLL